MKILFLTRRYYPHIGGVETHIRELVKNLKLIKKSEITIITEKYDQILKDEEEVGGVKIIRFSYPPKKYKGLIEIWKWLYKNRQLIKDADIVHCHDVFIWYLPFRFLFPFKKIFTTFHGWCGVYPIPLKEKLLIKLANLLSNKTIAIGKYIEKYYGIKSHRVFLGATDLRFKNYDLRKTSKTVLYLGRLEKDTGLLEFLKWLDIPKNKKYQVDFAGDGGLKEVCMRYGRVLGFVDPTNFLQRAEICVPGGYLSYIEAKAYKCKIMSFANNPLKEDYWKEVQKVKKFSTWEEIARIYFRLWK